MSAQHLLDTLSAARHSLYQATQAAAPAQAAATAIDAATLVSLVDEITHITISTHQLWHSLRRRAHHAADNEQLPDAVRDALTEFGERARHTARQAHSTVNSAQQARYTAHVLRDAVQGLKKCPQCGELAMRAVPTDLTAQQRTEGLKPSHAHHDRTQLCPVVGDNGYEPAQPVPATFTL
ncbi:MAG TPA: hypothetical protein VFX16_09580 [Pseudonocardiaceae bacterium]|nr:hypothetical protein [Pseudonocardiaceae bacterium]